MLCRFEWLLEVTGSFTVGLCDFELQVYKTLSSPYHICTIIGSRKLGPLANPWPGFSVLYFPFARLDSFHHADNYAIKCLAQYSPNDSYQLASKGGHERIIKFAS